MTRIHYLTTQVDELLSRLDQREAQIQKVHRQLDRQRQREHRADQAMVDVTPANPLSTPNPALRNARGHYVQLAFWPRKQHQPIVRTCLHLIAAALVVGFSFMLGLVVLQLLGQMSLVMVLLDVGSALVRVIIAISLVSGLIMMVNEAL